MRHSLRYASVVLVVAGMLLLAGCSVAGLGPKPTATPAGPTRTPRSDELNRVLQATPAPPGPGTTTPFGPAIARVRPAVVQVSNQKQVQPQQSNRPVPETQGIGSGVIYDPSGLVITNNHVVAGADTLLVGLPDGRSFQATVVGTDAETDLAVLRINGPNLPVATLGTASGVMTGDWVVAIGNALALSGGPTVTQGIVSATGRAIQVPSESGPPGPSTPSAGGQSTQAGTFLFDLIQTDAPINPGNSGGPLVDLAGTVIGINTVVAAATAQGQPVEGIGFAISVDTVKSIAGQLVATGRAVHPFLGITYAPLNPAVAASLKAPVDHGMFVLSVTANSPAAQAGIQQGDIILSIDGQQLTGESSLGQIINQHKPGDTIQLSILRNGQPRNVQVTLGQVPS